MRSRVYRFAWLAAWLREHGSIDADSVVVLKEYRKATGATEKHMRRDLGQMTREGIAGREIIKTGDPHGPAWIYRYYQLERKP